MQNRQTSESFVSRCQPKKFGEVARGLGLGRFGPTVEPKTTPNLPLFYLARKAQPIIPIPNFYARVTILPSYVGAYSSFRNQLYLHTLAS